MATAFGARMASSNRVQLICRTHTHTASLSLAPKLRALNQVLASATTPSNTEPLNANYGESSDTCQLLKHYSTQTNITDLGETKTHVHESHAMRLILTSSFSHRWQVTTVNTANGGSNSKRVRKRKISVSWLSTKELENLQKQYLKHSLWSLKF